MYLLVELFLIFVPITLFALWQIRAVRRSQAEADAKRREKQD